MSEIKKQNVDFNNNFLPLTRKKQFGDIFKHNWKKLGLIGLIIAFVAIPLIICHVIIPAAGDTLYASMKEAGKTDNEIIGIFTFYTFVSDCFAVIGYGLVSLAFAGGIRIIKNLVHNEGVLFKDDFIKGIKTYWKPFLCTFLIYGTTKALFKGIDLLTLNIDNNLIAVLTGIITALFYVVIVPVMMIYLGLSIYYQDSVGHHISNAFKIYVAYFVKNLIFVPWLLLLYYLLPLINIFAIRLTIELLIFVLIVPIYLLVYHLYITYVFDEMINIRLYPEIYRKGLAKIQDKNINKNNK